MTPIRRWSARRAAAHRAAAWGRLARHAVAVACRRGPSPETAAVFERLAGQCARDAGHDGAIALALAAESRAPGQKTEPRPGSSGARPRTSPE
jgi:hypothetical protein